MRITLNIDDDLLAKAQRVSGLKETTALVREGLKALIERESARRLARLGGSLGDVVGFEDAEHKAIAQLHKRCCDVVDAHDPSSAKNAAVPTALEFGQDLSDLQAVIKSIQDRRKNAKAAKSGS